MGQYYTAIVINENGDFKTLSPHDFGCGAKLMEFSWCENPFVSAVLSLIHNQKAKVAFIGDYAMDEYNEDALASRMSKKTFAKHYKNARSKDENFKMRKYRFTKEDMDLMNIDTVGMYLVNHDSGEFLDIETYIQNAKDFMHGEYWAINPLPLLTACGNGCGGGDYSYGNIGFDDVGIWAFAVLEYTEHIPEGYKQAHFMFNRGI